MYLTIYPIDVIVTEVQALLFHLPFNNQLNREAISPAGLAVLGAQTPKAVEATLQRGSPLLWSLY